MSMRALKRAAVLKSAEYNKFIAYFSSCPICHKKLCEGYIRELYLSKDPTTRKIRENLLKMISSKKVSSKNIIVGFPCCTCFENYFKDLSPERSDPPSPPQNLLYERLNNRKELTDKEFERHYQKFKPFLEKYVPLNLSLMEQNFDLKTVMDKIFTQITLHQIYQITLEIFENTEMMDFLNYIMDPFLIR